MGKEDRLQVHLNDDISRNNKQQNIIHCFIESPFSSRWVPEEVTVQKCEPVVRENCTMTMRTECEQACKETCQVQDKKVCMSIPQQECKETSVQQCRDIPKTECKKVSLSMPIKKLPLILRF